LPSRPRSADPGDAADSGPPEGAQSGGGIERRRHPRIRPDEAGPEGVATALRSAERRPTGERRASGGLRDNVGWTVASNRDSRFGGWRRLRVKKSRIFVLGIAMIAGGFAAYLASQVGRPSAPPPAAAAAANAATQVLVASQAVPAGQRLSASALAWQGMARTGCADRL
jgi:hypothetical protein